MKEHSIAMSAKMVRAILEGRKTMTRRPIKTFRHTFPWGIADAIKDEDGSPAFIDPENIKHLCPYGLPGVRLWVREPWKLIETFVSSDPIPNRVVYKASPETYANYPGIAWRPSIFMPRWASRITLEIIAVKAERLQEISDEDAMAEGVGIGMPRDYVWIKGRARQKFRSLWDVLYAKKGYGWDTNPWVWVIEFKRIEEAE